jgi:hypothetical protein
LGFGFLCLSRVAVAQQSDAEVEVVDADSDDQTVQVVSGPELPSAQETGPQPAVTQAAAETAEVAASGPQLPSKSKLIQETKVWPPRPLKDAAKPAAKPVGLTNQKAKAATCEGFGTCPIGTVNLIGRECPGGNCNQSSCCVAEAQKHAEAAKDAAAVAKQAATVATKVAEHSVHVTKHAKQALKHALGALHDARVNSTDLNDEQKKSLTKAEGHLREATKKAEYGEVKKVEDANSKKKAKMEVDIQQKPTASERDTMRAEINELRGELRKKCVEDHEVYKTLDELDAELANGQGPVADDAKAELEDVRKLVNGLDSDCVDKASVVTTVAPPPPPPRDTDDEEPKEEGPVTPIQDKGIDIDTAMPYGDLEPFGREDTAQELTESSIKESDEMVDQLERAEVAEEKRAVFRALTRLRGAAITSSDGVARSQTGNIDEYNKINKWRSTHPIHHLADEESDVSKWAFPDNAD